MKDAPAAIPPTPGAGAFMDRALPLAGLGAVLLITALLGAHSLGELDIWLHHRVGTDLMSGTGFPTTNTYAYTAPDTPWTNHEWLFQGLAAVTGPDLVPGQPPNVTGWHALRILLALGLMASFLLGDGQLRQLWHGQAAGRTWTQLGLLAGLLLLWPRLTLRPELISYILFVGLVRLAERALNGTPGEGWRTYLHPGRPVGGAFLLTVLWAQCHGFSALAPLVWILGGGAAWLDRRLTRPRPTAARWRPWLVGIGLLILAQLLTPNGLKGLLYPLKALGQFSGDGPDLRQSISELAPLFQTRDALGLTLLAFKISLVWGTGLILIRRGAMGTLRIALWILTAVAAIQAQRNIGFYALAFMLLHTRTAPALFLGPHFRSGLPGPLRLWSSLGTALTLGLAAWFGSALLSDGFYLGEGVSRRTGFGLTPARFSEAAAQKIGAGPDRLLTNVDGAAFLLDTARKSLFIDGRTEAYPPTHWRRYETLKAGGDPALRILAQQGRPQVYLTLANQALQPLRQTLLEAREWTLVQADEAGLLFLPRTAAQDPLTNQARLAALVAALPAPAADLAGARLADLLLARATLAALAGDLPRQEAWLTRARTTRPDHPAVAHNLGNLKLAQGDFRAALDLFEDALNRNGRLAGSALNAGVCLLNLDRPAGAEDYFLTAVSLQPGNFQGWVNLGVARQRQDDIPGAIQAFERALTLNPKHTAVRGAVNQMKAARRP